MLVDITPEYRVRITQHNHTLEYYEESREIRLGKYAGEMSKAGWDTVGYFANMPQILRGIMKHSLEVSNEVLTLDGYIDRIETIVNNLKEI